MPRKQTPAPVASGAGAAKCEPGGHKTQSSKNRAKRTASQQFAEDQLLAAIEDHGGKLYVVANDWATWRDKWFISPARAAEAACRLAADGVVTVKRHPSLIFVEMAARS